MKRRFIFITVLIIGLFGLSRILAAPFLGGFGSGNQTYACTSTVTSSECTNIVKVAAAQWNGHTTKASLTFSSTLDVTYQYPTASIRVNFSDSTANPTIYGSMSPLKGCSSVVNCYAASLTETWQKVDIIIFRKNIANRDTHINAKVKTATNEFGHSLSMADYIVAVDFTKSVMSQGISQNYTVKPYDVTELKSKWK